MSEQLPPQIAGFTYQRLIGRGGFSDVYLYRQQMPARDVAVKVLRTEAFGAASRAQFAAEANLMARVSSHTAIASIFTADVDDAGEPYLVMEYCPGGSLGETFRKQPLPVPRVLQLGVRLAGALECAHRVGIVHRDVKPANVLLTEYGMAVLTDFGISTIDDEFPEATLARAQVYAGAMEDSSAVGLSLPWAAPESLAENPVADTRSDRFSLAATLYALLAGHSPREIPGGPNGARDIKARIRTGFITQLRREDVPESFAEVLRRGLSYDPDQRYDSCLAMARALQQVQRDLGLEVTAVEVPGADLYDGNRVAARSPAFPAAAVPALPSVATGEATWLPPDAALPAAGEPGGGAPGGGAPGGHASTAYLPPPRPGQTPVPLPPPHRSHTPPGLLPMAPEHAPSPSTGTVQKVERVALVAAVVFVVVAVLVGSTWLINQYREPHFTGPAIDNLTVTETSANAYEITIPEGLELPDDLQVRVLDPGEGTALEDYAYAMISTDHTTWAEDQPLTLNPWASDVAGEDVAIAISDLREELALDPDIELRPGTVLLAAAPRAYFANRAPDLEITAGDSVLALITVVS